MMRIFSNTLLLLPLMALLALAGCGSTVTSTKNGPPPGLVQSSTALLAQANAIPQNALSLLQ